MFCFVFVSLFVSLSGKNPFKARTTKVCDGKLVHSQCLDVTNVRCDYGSRLTIIVIVINIIVILINVIVIAIHAIVIIINVIVIIINVIVIVFNAIVIVINTTVIIITSANIINVYSEVKCDARDDKAYRQSVVVVVGLHDNAVHARNGEGSRLNAGGILFRQPRPVVVVHLIVDVHSLCDTAEYNATPRH